MGERRNAHPIAAALVAGVVTLGLPVRWEQAQPGTLSQSTAIAHLELPDTSPETCGVCHDDVKAGEFVHGPVAGALCLSCHEFAGSGDRTTVRLAQGGMTANTRPLCISCHEDIAGSLQAAHAHGPAAAGDCLTCHEPHASARRMLLKAEGPGICTRCHEDVAKALSRRVKHAPAAVDCALCHDPHGTMHPQQLRAAVNDLCTSCHLVRGSGTETSATTLFGRPVPADQMRLLAPSRVVALDAERKRGHPILGHLVTAPVDSRNPPQLLTCVSCHEPHGTAARSLPKFDDANPSRACARCHK